MKKLLFIVVPLVITVFIFSSCEPETKDFDQALLMGKWVEEVWDDEEETWVAGTEYYKYNNDGTGSTWDTADDVTEEEGQAFEWTLVQDELTHMHIMEIGGVVPKVYTVTELSPGTLAYEDEFGKHFAYMKAD